jgi:hypothetical protein
MGMVCFYEGVVMDIRDMLMLGPLLFVTGLVLFSSAFLGNQILDNFKNATMISNNTIAVGAIEGAQRGLDKFDIIFMGFFIGFALFTWIAAYFIGGNPVFSAIYIIILLVMLILTPILANVWMLESQQTIWVDKLGSVPMMDAILSKLPLYVFIVELIGFIIMFAKSRQEGVGYSTGGL